MLNGTRRSWDAQADTFDESPDHGLRNPVTHQAWADLLGSVLPDPPARVLDLGSGTGSLAVLLALRGYDVTAVDLSPRMIQVATRKADQHRVSVRYIVGDAGRPPVTGPFEIVLGRHILWALPDAAAALDTWSDLLTTGGVLVLIEGFWNTGAGLRKAELLPLVQSRTLSTTCQPLADNTDLWGGPVNDERYLIIGVRGQH